MLMILLFACTSSTTVATPVESQSVIPTEVEVTTIDDTPVTDCDDWDYGLGLTLVNLPVGMSFHVTVVSDDGSILYEDQIVADACGTATPFAGVVLEDIGGFNDPSNVYVKAPESAGYVLYVGQLLDDDMNVPFPISTQWDVEASTEDTWVPISDDELGILVGPFMVL